MWELTAQTATYDIYEPLPQPQETYVAVLGNQLFIKRKENEDDGD